MGYKRHPNDTATSSNRKPNLLRGYFVIAVVRNEQCPQVYPEHEEQSPKTSVEAPRVLDQVKKLARAYTITPYQKAWESFQLKGAVAAVLP